MTATFNLYARHFDQREDSHPDFRFICKGRQLHDL